MLTCLCVCVRACTIHSFVEQRSNQLHCLIPVTCYVLFSASYKAACMNIGYIILRCYVTLCHVMLCFVMLCCYVTLCHYIVLCCYVTLCYVMLCYIMLCSYGHLINSSEEHGNSGTSLSYSSSRKTLISLTHHITFL
jgi:hypothetical protein